MFSSDQNVETFVQLFEQTKSYLKMQGDYVRLDLTEKMVRLLKALALFLLVLIFTLPVLLFLSLALAHAIASLTGMIGAYAIIAAVYSALMLLIFIKRKSWIERPLVRFLSSILLKD
jgi:positive regulator of sigma E activity